MTAVKVGSASHVALLYMKMVNCPVTYAELVEFTPVIKNARAHFYNNLKDMARNGLITMSGRNSATYSMQITQEGVLQAIQLGKIMLSYRTDEDWEDLLVD